MNISKENYESYLLDHIEGNLSAGQTSQLFNFLDSYPELKAELAAYERTIMVPDESIVFPDKASLKKREPRVVYFNTRLLSSLAIAASIALAVLFIRPLLKQTDTEQSGTVVATQENEASQLSSPEANDAIAEKNAVTEVFAADEGADEITGGGIKEEESKATPKSALADASIADPGASSASALDASIPDAGTPDASTPDASADVKVPGASGQIMVADQGDKNTGVTNSLVNKFEKEAEKLEVAASFAMAENLPEVETEEAAIVSALPLTEALIAAADLPIVADTDLAPLPDRPLDNNLSWKTQLDQVIDDGIENLWDGARTAAANIADPLGESTDQARVIRFKVGKISFYNRKIKKHAS